MTALFSLLLRVVLAVAGALLLLGLLALAAVTVLALTVWSLLRGRKPVLDFSAFAKARAFRAGQGFGPGFGQGASRRHAPAADVVDIEAREVPESPEATASRPQLR